MALVRSPVGYEPESRSNSGWFELPAARGLAGYGLSRALRILLDLLVGLRALHGTQTYREQPFVHGEVGPALLRVDELGVARLIPLAPWHWSPGAVQAKEERWGHLAPERLLGDVMDPRADVYSAGVLLWEALAGRRLFERESVESIITRLMGGKVHMPELPPELSWALPLKAIAMRALSVDPEQRFRSCAEFAHAIEDAAATRIASHGEVAAYFGARHPLVRSQPSLPNHNSSLSALVSPLHQAPVADPATADTESPPAGTKTARQLLAAAVLISVFAALAIIAMNRYQRERTGSPVTALPPAPISRLPLEAVAPSGDQTASRFPSALGGAASPRANAAPPPSALGGAASPRANSAPPPSAGGTRSTKSPTALKALKSSAPSAAKQKSTAKSAPSEAEQYGI